MSTYAAILVLPETFVIFLRHINKQYKLLPSKCYTGEISQDYSDFIFTSLKDSLWPLLLGLDTGNSRN